MWSKVSALVKEQRWDYSRWNVKNIKEFFRRGASQSQICYIYSYTYRRMIQFCYHLPPMKSWLALTDLRVRTFFAKSDRSKSFLRKPYLKNMSPKLFCYDVFSTGWLHRISSTKGCYAKSVSSESCLKKWY